MIIHWVYRIKPGMTVEEAMIEERAELRDIYRAAMKLLENKTDKNVDQLIERLKKYE